MLDDDEGTRGEQPSRTQRGQDAGVEARIVGWIDEDQVERSRQASDEREGIATHDLHDTKALTDEEVLKIECAARHFQALGFVTHISGRMVHVQPKRLYAAPRDSYEHFKKVDVNTGYLS